MSIKKKLTANLVIITTPTPYRKPRYIMRIHICIYILKYTYKRNLYRYFY